MWQPRRCTLSCHCAWSGALTIPLLRMYWNVLDKYSMRREASSSTCPVIQSISNVCSAMSLNIAKLNHLRKQHLLLDIPASTKHLHIKHLYNYGQRLQRWSNIVQMFCVYWDGSVGSYSAIIPDVYICCAVRAEKCSRLTDSRKGKAWRPARVISVTGGKPLPSQGRAWI